MIGRLTGRALATGALTMAVLLAPVTGAQAHSSQIGSSPEDGAQLTSAPSRVEVQFDTPLLGMGAALVVRASDGTSVVTGTPTVGRTAISAPVDPAAPPDDYTVAYRVVSEDGHTIESTFGYTVLGDTTAAPSPVPSVASTSGPTPAAAAPAGSGPPYLLIGAGVLVIILAGAGAIALRR